MYAKDIVEHSEFKLGEEDNLPVAQEDSLPAVQDTELDKDFELAKSNIKELIDKGSKSVDEILLIASQSDHPRAFEVAAAFLKQLTDMNKDVLELYKKKREIEKANGIPAQEAGVINNTQNIVFSGSTYDLQKQLAGIVDAEVEEIKEDGDS